MDPQTEKTFHSEVQAGQTGMNHKNVLRLMGAGRSGLMKGTKNMGDTFYIVSELAPNGEAFDYVEAAGGLTEPKARQMFGQLASAIEYVHKKGVAHRDLKLENCFLDSKAQIKVADFGLQKVFAGPNGKTLMTQCGTPNYMAPELKGEQKAYEGPPVDIFAMGVMLFIMNFAKFPFGEAGDAYYERMQNNPASYMKARKISGFSKELLDLMVGMTRQDVKERFTMDQIKSHPWFQGSTASEEDIRKDFYNVMPGKKVNDHNANEKKKSAYGKAVCVNRGKEDYLGADEETCKDWVEGLEFKPFHAVDATITGFFIKNACAVQVFSALTEYLAGQEMEYEVSSNTWKMKIQASLTVDDLEGAAPFVTKVSLVARLLCVEKDEEDEKNPNEMYLSFQRELGCGDAFNHFVSNCMTEKLSMFVEPKAMAVDEE